MEYLCEQRRQASLPGLAIEWGAVGDVGFVQDNPDQVGGGLVRRQTRDQSIASCIQALEKFMLAGGPVGCSYVPNDAIAASGNAAAPAEPADLPSIVKGILGLGAQQLVDEQLSLAEFGLDSLMAVEVQMQLKKRGIAMTLPAVRELSFARLASLVPAAVATPAKTPEAPLCQPLREGSDPTRVLYAVNGLMLAPRYLESVALPGDEAAYAVLYQNVAGVEALHDAWLAHLERLPAAVQTVRLFGYSIGALLAQRFAAFARERTGRRLEIVSVAPPLRDRLTPNYYGIELAGRTMVEALDALPRQELVALLQRFALYELKHDFMLLPLDDIKRQLKLVFERDPYEDPLATADVLALPQDDEHCLREEDARSLTRHLIRLDGRHDLRTLQLVEVFGCLA
ncbi:MAG: hypothetical protein H7Z15_23225 [Rhizobacter sp.]|nr:hypothetical protein [Rhizobacter sp.]